MQNKLRVKCIDVSNTSAIGGRSSEGLTLGKIYDVVGAFGETEDLLEDYKIINDHGVAKLYRKVRFARLSELVLAQERVKLEIFGTLTPEDDEEDIEVMEDPDTDPRWMGE